jgi:phage FluMu gp28-like protein
MTPELAQEFPDILRGLGSSLPDVLLSYQAKLLATTAISQVVVCEKSRRIGVTWAIAADAVLTAGAARSAAGMDVLYIGYNMDMAREFVDACAMWAKAFLPAASEVDEFLFKDTDDKGADRAIQAYRITFAAGFEIVALSSKPRSLRGRQGYLIFDEAAFHDDLPGMLKAGMAFLMWGGKILVISTHDGEANPFATLVNDSRAGRKPYAVVRITFDDAIADGLYERTALMAAARGIPVKPKDKWIADIRAFYGDDAAEELDVIPAQGTGTAISGALIEARMSPDIPVLRWTPPTGFSEWPEHLREAEARDWCEANLKPLLDNLDPKRQHFFGEDFGRLRDMTVIWPLALTQDMVRRAPFVVELAGVPFEQQRQVLFYILDRLPRFCGGAMDATGNGAYLAEVAAQRYGTGRIAQVMLSIQWYRENMPRFVAAFEDATTLLPRDADIGNDHRALKKVNGVIQVPALRAQDTKDRNRKRHGDSAIAHALAYFASIADVHEYGYTPAAAEAPAAEGRMIWRPRDDDNPTGGFDARSGLGGTRGGW